ncbi:Rrf2 family transcriptional regulator [Myxococcaceae bacterium JPH2]|nr:Rrf2 family transcriptional regulator [Myxococcaceae bacterium JPH2]
MNSRFVMAAHVLGMLAWHEREGAGTVTSEQMAASIQTNPVVVRRLLGDLSRAGLVETKRGAGGGVRLARGPESITLCDIYKAVGDGTELFGRHPSGANPTCAFAPVVVDYLDEVFKRAEAAVHESLGGTTVAQMSVEVGKRMGAHGGKGCR